MVDNWDGPSKGPSWFITNVWQEFT